MKLVSLLKVIDCEQKMNVCIEKNGALDAEVSGDQDSLMKMLSDEMFNSDVSCVEARDGDRLYVWIEEDAHAQTD